MSRCLSQEERTAIRRSLQRDWMGTVLGMIKEAGEFALDPTHDKVQEQRMRQLTPRARWSLLRKQIRASKSVARLGKTLRPGDAENVIRHLDILLENGLITKPSIARVVSQAR